MGFKHDRESNRRYVGKLARMIDPDFFGCSSKLSFEETFLLASANGVQSGASDFSELTSEGRIVTSIDRIHRCAKDWNKFACIALNHSFADVRCAGAVPIQVMLSFEFGMHVTSIERAECSDAFGRELAKRGIALGKCHSGHGSGATAVTVATLAQAPLRPSFELEKGHIYLSHPIGAFKLHYLAEMGFDDVTTQKIDLTENRLDTKFSKWPWNLLTDVSGHGLMGAISHVAAAHNLSVSLALSRKHAMSPEVFTIPVKCLQNSLSSYGIDMSKFDEKAKTLLTLRETAGPFLGFIEDTFLEDNPPGLILGRYNKGNEKVDITWKK